MQTFIMYLLVQLSALSLVNITSFLLFEILPIVLKKGNTIKHNIKDLFIFQFGMSFLSLIFGFLIYKTIIFFGLNFGLINISSAPIFVQVVIIYLISEFCIYLAHRFAHTLDIPVISKAHLFHHQITTDLQWVNSRREHPVVVFLFSLVFCVNLYILFKVNWLTTLAVVNVFVLLESFSHFRVPIYLKYLDKFFLFPKDHRAHHEKVGGPYGVTLSVFDTIFKTR
jgi:sterol desaturase/sphingolipid hydroxylase (fatty acid hydroxylase superfamily)